MKRFTHDYKSRDHWPVGVRRKTFSTILCCSASSGIGTKSFLKSTLATIPARVVTTRPYSQVCPERGSHSFLAILTTVS